MGLDQQPQLEAILTFPFSVSPTGPQAQHAIWKTWSVQPAGPQKRRLLTVWVP